MAALALLGSACSDGGMAPPVPSLVLRVSGDGQSGTVATAVPTPLVVRVEDDRGKPMAGVRVTWAASAGGTLSAVAPETGDDGTVAAVWTLGPGAGAQTATASAGGLPAVSFSATAVAGPPASVAAVSGDAQSGPVATKLAEALVVRVVDAHGNPAPGAIVAWIATTGGGSVGPPFSISDARGRASAVWTLGAGAGANTASAGPTGLPPVSFSATGVPGAPAGLVRAGGDGQEASVGETLPEPLVVRVEDAHGNPIRDVPVSWTVTEGGGSVAVISAASGDDGLARAVWTLGTTLGFNRVTASAEGLPAVEFVSVALAGPPASLTLVEGDAQSAVVGSTPPVPPTVRVADARGYGVVGVEVTWAVTGGGGTIEGVHTHSQGDGIALASWTLGTVPGPNSATASVAGLPPVAFTATAEAADPSVLVKVEGDGQSGTVGSELGLPLVVEVRDEHGRAVAGVAVSWNVTGDGSLSAASTVSGTSGRTSVSWTLGTTSGEQTVTATVEGLAPAEFLASAKAGAPARLTVVSGNGQSGTVGEPLPSSLVVGIYDAFENPVPGALVTWTSSTGTLSATQGSSGDDGLASTDWTLGDVVGQQTVTANVPGVSPVLFTATAVEPEGLNLSIETAYLVQSTQTPSGSVPLVANRDAYLRVFARASRSNDATPNVRVRLFHGATEVQSYDLAAPAASVPTTLDEANLGASWNVLVSGALIQPGLALSAEVDPSDSIEETDEADNAFPAAGSQPLDVRVVPAFRVRLVPVHQSANDMTGNVTDANRSSYTGFARRLYPFHEFDSDVRAPYTTSAPAVESDDGNNAWITILSELDALRVGEGSGRYYYGVVPVSYSSGIAGYGYVGRATAVGWDRLPSGGEVAAHEWGHNFGRQHAPCGGAGNPDPGYPYAGGSIGVFGMDVGANALKGPSSHFDLMGYCAPDWISDYTYKAVMNFRGTAAGAAATAAPRTSLLVWGRIGPDGPVLEPAFELVTTPVLPAAPGPHRIEALDETGRPLFALSFAATEVADAPEEARHFAFALPLDPGVRERLATLRLEVAGRLAERASAPGAAAPEVDVRRAGPGAVELRWDAGRSPVILVRDAVSGEIVSFARGGSATVASPARELELILSDGVRSERRRVVPR